MRAITTPAASSERTRGRHEAIGPLSTNASFFFDTIVVNRTDPAFICCYNFGTVSPIRENSSCRPALCFVLSEETKRYCASVVPDTKTDAKLVHQLSHTEANLKVWSYVSVRASSAHATAALLLYRYYCMPALKITKHTFNTYSTMQCDSVFCMEATLSTKKCCRRLTTFTSEFYWCSNIP